MKKLFLLTAMSALFASTASVYAWKNVNYDESKIPEYKLPNVLEKQDAKEAQSALEWLELVRPRIEKSVEEELFGKRPPRPSNIKFETVEEKEVFDSKAIRKQIKITVSDKGASKDFYMLLYTPKSDKPVPAFICLNFKGNHTTTDDKEIILTNAWARAVKGNKALEEHRGISKERWPFKEITERGYALATIYYGEIYPDKEKIDGTDESIYTIFDQTKPYAKGPAIAAWSWGLSRGIDALETLPEIDSDKVFVVGHSRLGKTSLLTGAFDKRVAIVASNNSGCMGSALSRREFGETVKIITTQFPFWFSPKLAQYADKVNDLPIDQHQFIAMIAPRPVYVASATEDKWADPKGELMSLIEAGKVYKLFGAKNLPTLSNFVAEKPFHGDLGYHLRTGKHNITLYDWMNYCDFADMHFGKQK